MPDKLFGFIEKKADFASLVALIISCVAGSYQLYWFFAESDVSLLEPQQVFFNKMERHRVRLVVPVTFLNQSTVQYNEVIRKVGLRMRFVGGEDVSLDYEWRSFAAFDPLQRSGKALLLTGLVHPVLVAGASSVSHEVEFAQPEAQCITQACGPNETRFLTWDDFIRLAKVSDRIKITLSATGVEDAYEIPCTLIIDPEFVKQIEKDKPWHAPPCLEPVRDTI